MAEKISKIIVRDQNGNLVQMLPRTASNAVSYGSGTVTSELQRQNGKDVNDASVSITSEQENKTYYSEVEEDFSMWVPNITVGYQGTLQGNNEIQYNCYDVFYDATIISSDFQNTLLSFDAQTNTIYSTTFSYSPNSSMTNIEYIGLGLEIYGSDTDNTKNWMMAVCSNIDMSNYASYFDYEVINSPYNNWTGNNTASSRNILPCISFQFPTEINEVKKLNTNLYLESNNINNTVTYIENPSIFFGELSITKIAEDTYKFDIAVKKMQLEEYETSVKSLKTEIELNDETVISNEVPISGLLQDVSLKKETEWVKTVQSDLNQSYYGYVVIDDTDLANEVS